MSAVPREQCGVEFCLVCSEDPSVCEECEEGYRLDDPTNCIVIEDEGGDGLDDAAIIGNTECNLAKYLLYNPRNRIAVASASIIYIFMNAESMYII